MLKFLIGALIGYAVGNLNFAYIIARFRGFDIRQKGTGNAGASNVMMTIGKRAGIIVMLLDILKSTGASLLVHYLFPELPYSCILGGAFCTLGHMFPAVLKFKGGKGLACLAGMVLAYDPMTFLIILLFEAVVAVYLDYVCVIPTTGSYIFAAVYALTAGEPIGTLLLASIAVFVTFKHTENFLRIKDGTEAHISILWHKDKEVKRLRKNSETSNERYSDLSA